MVTRLPKVLTKKRSEIAYERTQLEAKLSRLADELRAIDYTIRLIDPGWRPPEKVHKPVRSRGIGHGRIGRTCLTVLKGSPGIATPELADTVAALCGITPKTTQEQEDFASAVAMAMRRYEKKGVLEVTGKNGTTGALKWRIRT